MHWAPECLQDKHCYPWGQTSSPCQPWQTGPAPQHESPWPWGRGAKRGTGPAAAHPWKFPGTVILRFTSAFITRLTIS